MFFAGIYVFLFSFAIIIAAFAFHFGTHTAMFYMFKKIFSKEISIKKFFKEEVLQMTTTGLMLLITGVTLLFLSFGLFISDLFPIYQDNIFLSFFLINMFIFLLSNGMVIVIRKDTGGFYPWKGSLAVITGWFVIICAFIFALSIIWEIFVSNSN